MSKKTATPTAKQLDTHRTLQAQPVDKPAATYETELTSAQRKLLTELMQYTVTPGIIEDVLYKPSLSQIAASYDYITKLCQDSKAKLYEH